MQADTPPGQASEAARYAVLRRIGPALKHDLVVELQALAMMSEVIGARLDRGMPPLADLQHHLSRLQRGTREAVARALSVATWLSPPEDDRINLREGILECIALTRSALEFRGFRVRDDLPPTPIEVSHTSLRYLVLAAIIRLTDEATTPGELLVRSEVTPDLATLVLQMSPSAASDTTAALPQEAPYRRIEAREVQALAAAARVGLGHEPGRMTMQLDRLVPTTPLKIAPL